jgi:thymidylate synthase ThyX
MTANLREWRHFFKLRALRETGPAHPQMEELTQPLLCELYGHIPVIFDDLYATLQDLVETGKVKGDFETWPTYIRV